MLLYSIVDLIATPPADLLTSIGGSALQVRLPQPRTIFGNLDLYGGKATGGKKYLHVCISAAFYNILTLNYAKLHFWIAPHLLYPHLATPEILSHPSAPIPT